MLEPSPTIVDALMCPNETAAYLAFARPGSDVVAPLAVLDPEQLTHAGRVDALVAIERTQAWLAARQQQVLSTMTARAADTSDDIDRSGRDWVREDVSCALRLSGVTAQRRLDIARDLVRRLPATFALLESGEITYLHARTMSELTAELPDERATTVEERVVARAKEQTLAQFSASVRRAVTSVAAASVEQARILAMAERRVCLTARDDGMAELWALLPAEGAAVVHAAVTALAAATADRDERTSDQRRADALVDLAVRAVHDPLLPKSQGMRPAIQVTVALSTLLELDDEPGELAGHGPVPAAVARRMAADPTGSWRRLVVDPVDGRLLDYGRTTYRPPADLTDFVIARDRTCVFPTCNRDARRCEIDHRTPWSAGGATSPDNLQPLCTRHHLAKHDHFWQLERDPGGTYSWTSPTRHRYRATSAPLAIGRPPDAEAPPRIRRVTDPDPPPF